MIKKNWLSGTFYFHRRCIFILILCGLSVTCGLDKTKTSSITPPPVTPTSDSRVIANWDFVPEQYISSSVNVGVVAFHESGVDVEFEINGTKTRVTKPSANPDTGPSNLNSIIDDDVVFKNINEYYIKVDPADYQDGAIVIKATAYPDNGSYLPKVLPDLTLYKSSTAVKTMYVSESGNDSTGDGTSGSPYRNIEKGFVSAGAGGTVLVADGSYTWKSGVATGGNYTRWTTITSQSGNASGVIITPSTYPANDAFHQNYVKWSKVTIQKPAKIDGDTVNCAYSSKSEYNTWFDNCIIKSTPEEYEHPDTKEKKYIGTGAFLSGQLSNYYISDSHIKDFSGPGGWWMRNCVIENVGDDVWRAEDNAFYANIEIRGMYPKYNAHPDLIQYYSADNHIFDNLIFYNIKALDMLSQGLFGGGGSNVAYVNLLMDKPHQSDYHDNYLSQPGSFEHLLLWHCTTYYAEIILGPDDIRNNWSVINNIIHKISVTTQNPPSSTTIPGTNNIVEKNHFNVRTWTQSNGCLGSGYTGCPANGGEENSNPGFTEAVNKNFTITSGSPAHHAGVPLECVPADINGDLFNTGTPTIGAYASDSE